jgi:asparagine synthase (glutamine-hydrolysing)
MCGIAGLWTPGAAPDPATLHAMVAALGHRGPDGHGTFVDGPVGLAHARLAIIDLAGGAQPLANEDGTVHVTFNGEVFNYVELRERLRAAGHRFATDSDTEVIVHLYEDLGDEFLHHLNGQFALALWDSRRRRLLLARDPVGIRPLHYAWQGRRLAFASEVKALFAVPGQQRRFSEEGLAQTFSLWAAQPPATVFEGVSALPPGHRMIVSEVGTRVERWWHWPEPADDAAPADEDALADELHALVVDAVRLQLRADVPVGAYLSGGLDSSIVTAAIDRYTDTPLRTFSLTFDDPEYDESAHQRELSAHLGTRHTALPCSRADIAAAFPRCVWHAETPLVRAAPAPMMRLADCVRDAGYKVVLTGEGADEVFAGYDLFKEAKARRFIARRPESTRRRRIVERLYPYLAASPAQGRGLAQQFFTQGLDRIDHPAFAHLTRIATTRRSLALFLPALQERLGGYDAEATIAALMPAGSQRWPALARDQYVEATTLMGSYLLSSQADRMAMAASVEARFPFLDPRLIDFAARLPSRLKMRGLREKLLLRKAFARDLPPGVGSRPKQPYRVPDANSFFADGRPLPWVAELLSDASVRDAALFDAPTVARLTAKCAAGRAIGFGDNMAFVGVLSTQLVHRQLIRDNAPWTP